MGWFSRKGRRGEWVNDEKVIVVSYQRDAGAHLDDLITDAGNGLKEFNFADIAKFKYPRRWGTPEMNTERAVFYEKNKFEGYVRMG